MSPVIKSVKGKLNSKYYMAFPSMAVSSKVACVTAASPRKNNPIFFRGEAAVTKATSKAHHRT